jgi:hypothetical protein
VIIAEVGVDITSSRPRHTCVRGPGSPRREGVRRPQEGQTAPPATATGNRYLAAVLGEAAVAAAGTHLSGRTLLTHRPATWQEAGHRRGRPIHAVVAWHLLAESEAHFIDLGADYYETHLNTNNKKRHHVRQLEALGYKVPLEPDA